MLHYISRDMKNVTATLPEWYDAVLEAVVKRLKKLHDCSMGPDHVTSDEFRGRLSASSRIPPTLRR